MPVLRYGSEQIATATLLLCAFLLWLINHPLHGVDYHDAIIYTALALHALDPAAFSRDPFFMFGSQDSFSLFSALYAPLIDRFGITVAAASVLLLGGVLWCIAAIAMARSLMGRIWPAAMAVLLTAVLCANYSPNGATFQLNEGFATARVLAFSFGALAMALLVSGHRYAAWAFAVLSSLLHPLIGVWSVLVMVLFLLPPRPRYVLCAIGGVAFALMMVSELGPFQRFDDAWEKVLRDGTHDLFVNPPDEMRWRDHAVQLLTLLLVALHLDVREPAQARLARFYRVVALVAGAGFVASLLASWYWPSRIVIQAQMWRSMWLAAYLAPFAACHLLWHLRESLRPPQGGWPWLLTAVLALIFLLQFALVYVLLAWLLMCLTGMRAISGAGLASLHARRWLPWLSLALVSLALPNFVAELSLLEGRLELPFTLNVPLLAGFLLHGGVGAGAALLALGLHRYGSRPWLLASLLVLVVAALMHWDLRNMRDKQWEARAAFGADDELTKLIRPGEVVLWEGRMPVNVWYELRTANYASPIQAIGMVFSREKTFELLARAQHVRAASAYESGESAPAQNGASPFSFEVPKGKGIPLLCRDAQELDWVIVQLRVPPEIKGWHSVADPYEPSTGRAYAFACAQFRTPGAGT